MTRARCGTERGSVVVETLLVVPVVIFAVMFVVWAGRGPSAVAETVRVANNAARVASIEQTPSDAAAAVAALDTSSVVCTSMVVDLDTSRWDEGWVSAEARCVPNTSGLDDLGVGEPVVQRSVAQVQQWGTRG